MPANGFNIGKDVQLDIITPAGVLRASIRTDFTSKQDTTSLDVKGADGINRFAEIPAGWSGSFTFERADSRMDDYFAQSESDYYAGVASGTVSITETTQEVSGAITQFRYTGVVLKYEDAGGKASDKTITTKVSFKASKRLKVT